MDHFLKGFAVVALLMWAVSCGKHTETITYVSPHAPRTVASIDDNIFLKIWHKARCKSKPGKTTRKRLPEFPPLKDIEINVEITPEKIAPGKSCIAGETYGLIDKHTMYCSNDCDANFSILYIFEILAK